MKTLYMLDSDICSYIIKGGNPSLAAKVKAHQENLCISSVTLAELLFGVAKKNSPKLADAVTAFQQLVEVKPWTAEAAEFYAVIRRKLELTGSPIGAMDFLIAAAAMADNAILVTNNTAHFSRVPGLKIENWTS
ncbi:MAG: type II toxin-antitoxin system VapC family toxin [Victivallaceae bacterium]